MLPASARSSLLVPPDPPGRNSSNALGIDDIKRPKPLSRPAPTWGNLSRNWSTWRKRAARAETPSAHRTTPTCPGQNRDHPNGGTTFFLRYKFINLILNLLQSTAQMQELLQTEVPGGLLEIVLRPILSILAPSNLGTPPMHVTILQKTAGILPTTKAR